MNYSPEVRAEAQRFFNLNFSDLSFELLKKAEGEDSIIDLIVRPSDEKIVEEFRDEVLADVEEKVSKEGLLEMCLDFYYESEHYPMWLTVFEAKEDFISDKIMKGIDELYDLGIGVIAPTDNANACLFIAGAGYDFYSAHWIPLFELWGYLDTEKIEKEAKEDEALAKLGISRNTKIDLMELSRSKDITTKRHAEGLLKALKL